MPQSGNGPRRYQVQCSKVVANSLRLLHRRASHLGQANASIAALRRIVRAIQENARTVGEPLYQLPAVRLQVRPIVIAPVVIDFAVSDDSAIVYIKSGRLLSLPQT
jgi:hypothetical protein